MTKPPLPRLRGAITNVDLFNPDTLLPAQYFALHSRDSGIQSERHLMLAVLREAVDCYQKYALARDARGRAMFAGAADWIESTDREWPFSYENICEVLGLEPAYLRGGLSKWCQHKTPSARRPARIEPLFERRSMERDLMTLRTSEDTGDPN
jgi:hypothetical protein